jgi:predicted nuclease of predicted toxin-antitoxin system
MKLLFDQNLSFKLCEQVADVFAGSTQVRLVQLDRADDRAVWDFAGRHNYALVTLDSDFADMAALLGPPPKVIWLRCGNQTTAVIAKLLRSNADAIAAFELSSAACLEIY